jgi:myosin heavy subunit
MIEAPRGGLLALLDEACTFRNASSKTFATAVGNRFGLLQTSASSLSDEPRLVSPPKSGRVFESFCVHHYAGEVCRRRLCWIGSCESV